MNTMTIGQLDPPKATAITTVTANLNAVEIDDAQTAGRRYVT